MRVSPRRRDLCFFRFLKDGDRASGDIFRIDARVLDALKGKAGSN